MTMTARGKAFEYALAQQLSITTGAPIERAPGHEVAEGYYREYGIKGSMDEAAREAVLFLCAYDSRFDRTHSIHIQSDSRGQSGDVRDVIARLFGAEIGISAKNRHAAVKHSRLSPTIDWGDRWADYPVSQQYWNNVTPIFDMLKDLREQQIYFRDIRNKEQTIYLPILTAFEDELTRLTQSFGANFIKQMFQYLVGKYDFYKVMNQSGNVSIQSFNINGTLEWGNRWRIPYGIDMVRRKPGSNNTLIVNFTGGWQMSFRIHNASAMAEPSLKFDIQFTALPTSVATHQIPLG